MIDTIKIACLILNPPSAEELSLLGWKKKYDKTTGIVSWFYKKEGEKPYISIYKSPIGKTYIWVNVSLPAFFLGSNARLLTEDEVAEALRRLSEFVTDRSGVEFKAENATVWNVHFTKDYYVGEESIFPIISRLSKINISRFETGAYGKTSCYFHSKGAARTKKKPRTICVYGKHADAIAKGFSKEDVELSKGILRAELRYRDKRAVKRLCDALELSDRRASTLFTKEVSQKVLEAIEQQILLLAEDLDNKDRILKMFEAFGSRHSRSLIVHLVMRDIFGFDYYKNEMLGFSRSHYFACERECRKIGVWSLIMQHHLEIKIANLP